MSTNTLDMKWIAKDVTFGSGELDTKYAYVYANEHPITLDFKAANVEPAGEGRKILIMQARRDGEELWGIRMLTSCRLLFQPGTGPSRESLYGYVGDLSLGVSFNPLTQALSIIARDAFGSVESFNLNAHSPWASATGDYEILLGAPEQYADRTMEGWVVDCSFRYGPVTPDREDPVLGAEEPWRGDPKIRKSMVDLDLPLEADPLAPPLVGAVDDQRHWEAMLALASGRHLSAAFHPDEIAREAQALLNAHNAWKEGRS